MRTILFIVTLVSMFINDECRLVKNALQNEEIQHYLHPELESRQTLYLVKNEYCNFEGTIDKIKVVTVERSKLQSKNFVEITSTKKKEEGFELSITYPIEGAIFHIKYDKDSKITDVNIIEK